MTSPPALFDRKVLWRQRARALDSPDSAWFLHEVAAKQVQERLAEINRQFTNPVIVGWRAEAWTSYLDFSAQCVPDNETLDLKENSADLIIHALGLHWSNDPVGQLIQMNQALKPDGLMIAVMFAGDTLSELRDCLGRAEVDIEGGLSPRIAPMGDLRSLGSLLQRSGFALPVADSQKIDVSYQTGVHLMRDLRAMGETNCLTARRKTVLRHDTFQSCLDLLGASFSDQDGRIATTFELAFLTGWAASPDQQKPLTPGSAKMRLSDALEPPN